MRKVSKGISYTTRYLILLGAILLVANIILGAVLIQQSISTIQSMVRKSMLSVVTTASALIDGNDLGALTEEDIGSPSYNEIYDQLSAFQKNVNIEFIYAVRQAGDDEFIFTVDPDPEEPADFGDSVVVTDALRNASKGIASVDDAAAEDEWGNFYSAYSPVFDSEGNVAGIIGVDFDAEWFKDQMMENSWSIVVISVISVGVACLLVVLFTTRLRKQYRQLNKALTVFSSDIDELKNEISSDFIIPGEQPVPDEAAEAPLPLKGADAEIEEMRLKMNSLHNEIRQYLTYIQKKATTDAMTHVGNNSAFEEAFRSMDQKISEGTADFYVGVFDINYLKPVNDEYGHTYGNTIIQAAAAVIAEVFGYDNTYRIGGDEFLVIVEHISADEMAAQFTQLDNAISLYNKTNPDSKVTLSIAKGYAGFRRGEDESFKQVFQRADNEMYANKEACHTRIHFTLN